MQSHIQGVKRPARSVRFEDDEITLDTYKPVDIGMEERAL